jgi:ribosomal protein L15
MRTKKRKKTTRMRGAETFGHGFRQKVKGHGNSGGPGMSGSGKRGDQKKQKALALAKKMGFKSYFGKQGMTSASTAKRKYKFMNLEQIKENLFSKDAEKIDLKNYKILGKGEGFKATIEAKEATKGAIEKMEKAGGKIVLPTKKEKVVEKKTSEKSVKGESDAGKDSSSN